MKSSIRSKTTIIILLLFVLLVSIPPTKAAPPYDFEEDGSDTVPWAWGDYEEGGETLSSDGDMLRFEGEGDSANDVDYVHSNEPSAIDWESNMTATIRYKMSSLLADSIDLYLLNHTYVSGSAAPCWFIVLVESTSWIIRTFNISDCSTSGSPIGNIEALVFRFQADNGIDVDFDVDYIRFGTEWVSIGSVEFIFDVDWHPVAQFGYDMFFILAGLIMIPASTMYLVRGGRKEMSRDKLFYALIIFFVGLGLLIGGVSP